MTGPGPRRGPRARDATPGTSHPRVRPSAGLGPVAPRDIRVVALWAPGSDLLALWPTGPQPPWALWSTGPQPSWPVGPGAARRGAARQRVSGHAKRVRRAGW